MDDQSQAYEEIIGPIEDRMLRSIWRITRDAHDAEDAMQNALVTLWKRWNRVRCHASPQTLVLKICVDAALDVARRRVRDRRNIESNDPASHPADGLRLPLEELANAELRREVLAAIGRLSSRQAVTVMLRAFEELPYSEIAAALGCTEATARKHFERACAQLRLALRGINRTSPSEVLMIAPDDSRLDERIITGLSGNPPAAVEERLHSQLVDFRRRLAAPHPIAVDRGPIWGRPRWWGLGIAVAALVAALMIALFLRSPASLADVTGAVFAKPWIHVEIAGLGRLAEAWYSPSKGITASRSPDSIQYIDHQVLIEYSYHPREQTLYRLPDSQRNPSREIESLATVMTVLSQQRKGSRELLQHFPFFRHEREPIQVLDQKVEQVTENGHTWLDDRVVFSGPKSTQPVRMLFRADPATKLLNRCRLEAEVQGKSVGWEMRFSYPETGPTDVYALGVPRSARLVDRVPAGDVQRILQTIQAGRVRMDSYRAVFVKQDGDASSAWWRSFPAILYRKGDRFRRDLVRTGTPSSDVAPPGSGEDPGKWWENRVKQLRFDPHYVMRGVRNYSPEFKEVTDADGATHLEIVSVRTFDTNLPPGETYPMDYALRPEFACRPPLGIGAFDVEPSIELHPADGPAGCILLSTQHTSARDRINEKGVGLPDCWRFWVDPQRDDIVMRTAMVVRDANGSERIIHDQIVEETARSPQGVWYATKVRLKNAVHDGKGKSHDQIYHIYVDFGAHLSDSLFDPPHPGRLD